MTLKGRLGIRGTPNPIQEATPCHWAMFLLLQSPRQAPCLPTSGVAVAETSTVSYYIRRRIRASVRNLQEDCTQPTCMPILATL